MYAYISGSLVSKNPAFVVLEANGIGYQLHISLNTYAAIGDQKEVKLYTYLAIREDAHILFGFADERERALFLQLISVSGVGPNTARLILSSLTADETIEAISLGNIHVLQSVKGIGGKTAQRILVDLKDKVAKAASLPEKVESAHNRLKEEALSGLLILGFVRSQAEKALDRVLKSTPGASVEVLIKEALKIL
jgi:Holliday junction DNA helicase RuvA